MTSRVCVIIPTVDNSTELAVVLEGLSNQTFQEIDVAVVGPAGDQGRQVTEDRGFRYIDDRGSRNRADACNVAIEETESELVLFTDDDVIVPQDWVEKLERWFQRPEVSGVGGPTSHPLMNPISGRNQLMLLSATNSSPLERIVAEGRKGPSRKWSNFLE